MSRRLTCSFPSLSTSYEICIQSGLLNGLSLLLKSFGNRFALITHEELAALYGEKLFASLSPTLEIDLFTFPAGEAHKTRATKSLLEDQLLEKGFSRDTCIVAFGGGVVTDLAGYIAATYCRGVSLVTIPTSLLAMVDASIGGKTGVNTAQGKNMIGCIYQPKKVLIDPTLLQTLPLHELRQGIIEMIKHGLITDHHYFEELEKQMNHLLARDLEVLEKAIYESCRIKKEIVEEDERESGKRHLLNFGHTVAHALESLTKYRMPHGEAVAIGILVESYLSTKLGDLDNDALTRIHNLLIACGIPLHFPSFSASDIFEAMTVDKKSLKGKPRCVILNKIGEAARFGSSYCTVIEQKWLSEAIDWVRNAVCCH